MTGPSPDPGGTLLPLPLPAGTPVSAFSLDGLRAAVLCGGTVVTGSLGDPDSWTELRPGGVGVALRGERVFTADGDSVVAVEGATGRQVARLGPTTHPLAAFAVTADGACAALGEYRTVSVWDVASGRRVAAWRAHRRVIGYVAFSPDGRTLVTRSFEDVALWRRRGRPRRIGHPRTAVPSSRAMAVAPDGRLAGAVDHGAVAIWSRRGRRRRELAGPGEYVRSVAFAPDGQRLAARDTEGAIRVWALPGGDVVAEHEASRMGEGLGFGGDGDLLVAGDESALLAWGDGVPEPAPERFVPLVPTLLDDHGPPSALDGAPVDAGRVEALARDMPWLTRLGAPTSYDGGVDRLRDLDGWRGPEDRDVDALISLLTRMDAGVERAVRGLHRRDVAERAEAVTVLVRERGFTVMGEEAAEGDPWDAETMAVWQASWVAGILVAHALLGWPVPADLRAVWRWYEAGHWPCAMHARRLLVI